MHGRSWLSLLDGSTLTEFPAKRADDCEIRMQETTLEGLPDVAAAVGRAQTAKAALPGAISMFQAGRGHQRLYPLVCKAFLPRTVRNGASVSRRTADTPPSTLSA